MLLSLAKSATELLMDMKAWDPPLGHQFGTLMSCQGLEHSTDWLTDSHYSYLSTRHVISRNQQVLAADSRNLIRCGLRCCSWV